MLIDEYLPIYHESERHGLAIRAPAHAVYAALRTADLGGHPVTKALMTLRSLPAVVAAPRDAAARLARLRTRSRITLDDVLRHGFVRLDEDPGRELLLGVVGRFWRPTGNIETCDAARFRGPLEPGKAKAAWNFVVHAQGRHATLLTTETRVHCSDAAALRSFRRYWLVVRPFSGLIRRLMLESIGRACAKAG
jgi:hypothetical protein